MNPREGYQDLRRIGSGVSGPVYLAETNGQYVVIRQFESQAAPGSPLWLRERQHFLNAGRQSVDLKHRNIVPVLETIDEAGEAFVVMEYMTGGTMEGMLAQRTLTSEEAGTILRDIAMALDYAHSHGVVHGDLKPSNIFVGSQGMMISDFAISPRAALDRNPLAQNLVHPYLSPEHLTNPPTIGARADQYALGVIAYQMYTGSMPYARADGNYAAAIAEGQINPPSQLQPHLPKTIDAPMLRVLSRDPDARFASCIDFVAFLGAALIAESPVRRPGRLAALLAAAFLVPLALFGVWKGWSNKAADSPAKVQATITQTLRPLDPVDKPTPNVPGNAGGPKVSPPPKGQGSAGVSSQPGKKIGNGVGGPSNDQDIAANPTPPQGANPGGSNPRQGGPDTAGASALANRFSIDLVSRTRRVENGSSFPFNDTQFGEMANGDLNAMVTFEGQRLPPRARLTLEWSVDNVVTDSAKPVTLNQLQRYGNEPTAGSYRISLKLNGVEVRTFTFRITP